MVWSLVLVLTLGVLSASAATPAGTAPATPSVLRVVGDDNYPPFLFRDPSGEAVGYVADWWALWSRKTGVKVELRALQWAEAQRTMARGEADAIDNIFRTPGREPLYEFTAPYATVPVGVFVASSVSGIRDVHGLRGFQVGVMEGDACVETLRSQGVQNLHLYRSYAALVEGALADEVRIFCLDDYPAGYYLTRAGAQNRFVKAFQLYEGKFHRAVPKGRLDLLALVERGAAAISAEEDAALRRKWMPPPPADLGPWLRVLSVALAVLALLAAGLFAWLRTLRGAVRRQTAELQASREQLQQRVAEATESLRSTNEQLQTLVDTVPVGILRTRRRIIERCSRRFDELFGYDEAELVGRSTELLFADAQVWVEVGRQSRERYARGQALHCDFQARRKDGSVFVARLCSRAIHPDAPEDGVVSTIEDVTAEHEAARQLEAANAEQRAVFDAATVGIVLTRDNVILRCNRTMEQLFGYEAGGLLGCTSRVLYPDDASFEETSARIAAAMHEGGLFHEERELVRKDGTRFWCRKMLQSIDHQDPARGFAATFEDISTERQARVETERARALAEDAARTKSEFLANMSHEIRTPLNSVIGLTLLLQKTELTAGQRDSLQKIQRSGQHLLHVINDILDFSKIESGRMVLEQIDFDVDRVLEDTVSMFAEAAARRGLELIVHADADVPRHLVGDPLRIGQVLFNFVSNAVKFTEHGEVELRVQREGQEADGRVQLRLAVRDTGIGIAPEQRELLFRSFSQADSSTTRRFGGTGLGLVIARRLAELMGGEIGVDSEPGHGSTFWLRVALPPGQARVRRQQVPGHLAGLRLLVVDDHPHARQAMTETLRSMRFGAHAVGSGPQALAELARADTGGEPYDVVLLDWRMPGMDGLATAQEIRRLTLSRQPAMLMVTAYGRDEVTPQALQAGIDRVLGKPVTPSQLFEAVIGACGDVAAEPAPASAAPAPPPAASSTLAGARALLVEDNELNQEVAIAFLQDVGLQVDLAPDGAVAVERVVAGDYDVVLMDMQMPVMDGLEATRRIRALPGRERLPIVAMTANAMASDRARCLEAGMDDHLAKPIDPDELLRTLQRWVRPRAPQHVLPPASPPGAGTSWEALHGLPGLDVRAGLLHVMGREDLYLHLLERFVDGQRDAPARILQRVMQGDRSGAERQAHTLKGLAAQVGAEPVREAAQALERALRADDELPALQGLAGELQQRLAPLLEAIATVLRVAVPAGVPSGPPAPAGPDGAAALAELARLLLENDFAAVQHLQRHEAVLRPRLGERFDALQRAVQDYDFENALQMLPAAPKLPPAPGTDASSTA